MTQRVKIIKLAVRLKVPKDLFIDDVALKLSGAAFRCAKEMEKTSGIKCLDVGHDIIDVK